jgi:hypothetical protein
MRRGTVGTLVVDEVRKAIEMGLWFGGRVRVLGI